MVRRIVSMVGGHHFLIYGFPVRWDDTRSSGVGKIIYTIKNHVDVVDSIIIENGDDESREVKMPFRKRTAKFF